VILGTVILARRSRVLCFVMVAPLLVVAVNSAIFYGSTRMRMAAEPSLAVLGALGIVAAARMVWSYKHRSTSSTVLHST
jgi:xanthosine utilization system XapX-like protein